MARILFLFGIFWLAAAFWRDQGGSVEFLWMALLPVTWLAAASLLWEE